MFKKDLSKLNSNTVKIDNVDELAQDINNELFIGTGTYHRIVYDACVLTYRRPY